MQIAANGAHDDLAGVQPDADLDHRRVRAPHLFRVLPHAFLHAERREAGPHGVVLVRERRAEEGHDPVAHDLVHGALVAVDSFHHPLEDRIEELPRLLGVAVGEQLHRALEVGEEHGHLLPFAFERALGGQDFLGEVLGGVGLGRGELVRRRAERSGALAAELVLGGIGCATGGADRREWSGAFPAELHARRVVLLAPGTPHTEPPSRVGGRGERLQGA